MDRYEIHAGGIIGQSGHTGEFNCDIICTTERSDVAAFIAERMNKGINELYISGSPYPSGDIPQPGFQAFRRHPHPHPPARSHRYAAYGPDIHLRHLNVNDVMQIPA